MKNRTGQVISSSVSRDVLTSLPGAVAPLQGLAQGLQELKKGEKRSISVTAAEAYGFYDPRKVIFVPRASIRSAKPLEPGLVINQVSKSGVGAQYTVLQVRKHLVQLDGNHPLAGQDLAFEIEALDVRDATPDEISEAMNPVSQQALH